MLPKRQISIINGASGSGKTTLILQAIHAHQSGRGFPIEFRGSSFAYIVADRTKDETEKKAKELGVDIEIYGVVDDNTFHTHMLEKPRSALEEILKKFKKPYDILIIDPLMLFMQGSNIDYKSVAISLIHLNRIAFAADITILGVHHSTKTRSDFKFLRPQDRISGSAAFQGYSGTQLSLISAGESGEPFDELHIVSHTAAPVKVELTRDEDGWFRVLSGQGGNKLGKFAPLFLERQTATAAQIVEYAESIGMSRRQAFRSIKYLRGEKVLDKVERGIYTPSVKH